MEFIIALCIFLVGVFAHEVGHILLGWYYSKEIPTIRFRKIGIMVIPKTIYSFRQKQVFLGTPIIIGMFAISPFFYYYPENTYFALLAYLISCGADFYNLIKLEVKK